MKSFDGEIINGDISIPTMQLYLVGCNEPIISAKVLA
jgi:hypothetical protein